MMIGNWPASSPSLIPSDRKHRVSSELFTSEEQTSGCYQASQNVETKFLFLILLRIREHLLLIHEEFFWLFICEYLYTLETLLFALLKSESSILTPIFY
jgi:hypothetical protein